MTEIYVDNDKRINVLIQILFVESCMKNLISLKDKNIDLKAKKNHIINTFSCFYSLFFKHYRK